MPGPVAAIVAMALDGPLPHVAVGVEVELVALLTTTVMPLVPCTRRTEEGKGIVIAALEENGMA